jgi:hypothetical protein
MMLAAMRLENKKTFLYCNVGKTNQEKNIPLWEIFSRG